MEGFDFNFESIDELMEWAQDMGMKNAKVIGVLASEAWDALERKNYAEASTIYSIISRMTNTLSTQTYAMKQQEIMDRADST